MKFPLDDKTFGPGPTFSKPFAATCAALSALDPAPYSLPESPSFGPSSKCYFMLAAPPCPASLPGCALRPSMDVTDSKSHRPAGSPLCCQPDLLAQRDVDAVPDVRLGGAVATAAASTSSLPRQQQLKASAAPRRASLHYERDANRARRNYRTSLDAAAGAVMLYTSPAEEAPPFPQTAAVAPDQSPCLAACEMPGCIPPAPVPFAPLSQLSTQRVSAAAAAAAAAPLNEWSFGDNLQRARMLARYAAMASAEELRYDLSPGGAFGSDSGDDDGGGSRRSRGAWKMLSSLLSSSKGRGKAAAAAASLVQRWQGATTSAMGCRQEGGGGGGAATTAPVATAYSRRSMAEDVPVVVRSRDSRRLMRVHRSRVGIDREGQTPQQGRASAPTLTQQQQNKLSSRQPHSRSSAPAMLAWDGGEMYGNDDNDAATAAVIAAAAEFAAVAAAERPP